MRAEVAFGTRRVVNSRERLYLACTDGVGTDEERRFGTAPDGTTWKEVPRPLATLLGDLATGWSALQVASSAAHALGATLQATLDRLLADGALEDDATVGAVLLLPASPVQGQADEAYL